MTTVDFLKNQVVETRSFTKRLISEMPDDLWFDIPEGTNSNFAWQVGHILLAQNYHIISCAFGRDKSVFNRIPMKEWAKVFGGLGSQNRSVTKDFVKISELKNNLDFVYNLCIEKLDAANDEFLTKELEPTPFKGVLNTKCGIVLKWSK